MSKLRILAASAVMLASMGTLPLSAQDGGNGPGRAPFLQRYPAYTAWHFDGRDDVRDFPTNGFFPGDFAADPAHVAIGAAGLFGFTPEHAGARRVDGYYQADCARSYRSYNPATGYFMGHDGTRHRCR